MSTHTGGSRHGGGDSLAASLVVTARTALSPSYWTLTVHDPREVAGMSDRTIKAHDVDPCDLTYSDLMPLIEVLSKVRELDAPAICSRISNEVALAIGARPEAVWVTWATYEHSHGVPGRLVHVHGRRNADQMEALTAALERILGDDVFITVTPVWAIDPDA